VDHHIVVWLYFRDIVCFGAQSSIMILSLKDFLVGLKEEGVFKPSLVSTLDVKLLGIPEENPYTFL